MSQGNLFLLSHLTRARDCGGWDRSTVPRHLPILQPARWLGVPWHDHLAGQTKLFFLSTVHHDKNILWYLLHQMHLTAISSSFCYISIIVKQSLAQQLTLQSEWMSFPWLLWWSNWQNAERNFNLLWIANTAKSPQISSPNICFYSYTQWIVRRQLEIVTIYHLTKLLPYELRIVSEK